MRPALHDPTPSLHAPNNHPLTTESSHRYFPFHPAQPRNPPLVARHASMLLHADYSKPASLRFSSLEFIASPSPHVTRGMLDRVGGEVARSTTLVRYAPGSSFPAHTHGGGEEFLVLEGEFADEHGVCPTGTYIRNPVGSRHNPRVGAEGCLIFVKLRWMRGNEPYVIYDFEKDELGKTSPYLLSADGGLDPVDLPPNQSDEGNARTVYYAPNSMSGTERVRILKLSPDQPRFEVPVDEIRAGGLIALISSQPPFIPLSLGGLELLIFSGSVTFDGETWDKWDWIRRPSTFANATIELAPGCQGAVCYLKTGYQTGWPAEEP